MKRLFVFCGILFFPYLAFSQKMPAVDYVAEPLDTVPVTLDSVVVSGNLATSKTPVTFTTISKDAIQKASADASLPMLLKLQPSVVSTTESGSGLGYTRLSVRGSDATRINVTLNGVAMNDAESQEVFWVNLPLLPKFLESIQLQRGIGTSMNGPGAFGASINMQTSFTAPKPYAEAEISYGSFNTTAASVGAGTSLLPSGFSFDVKYNHSSTDGYIRNGKADLNSLYASVGLLKGSNAIKLIYIFGDQHTGITWEGASKEMMASDRRSNPAGMYYDEAGNVHYYDNETDNYTQHFVQAFYSHQFAHGLLWSNTFNFTKGDGYYENYKADKKFSAYGIMPQNVAGHEYDRSDMIVRQYMDNSYFVGTTTLKYSATGIRASAGVNYSYYGGKHFGDVLWSKWNADIPEDYRWYDNVGNKWETDAFLRGEFDIEKFTIYADMQYRHIDLDMYGQDNDLASLDHKSVHNFFNPKAGVNFIINDHNAVYASYALGHKEPSRSDIKESIKSDGADAVKPETMHDVEIGYKYNSKKLTLGVNVYLMEYVDQLVSTGKISSTGYVIKENVPVSYRRGVELSLGWQIIPILRFDANMTLSVNKIKDYTAWVDTYDNSSDWNQMPQTPEHFGETDLTMSPAIVGMGMFTINPLKRASLSIDGKYVGKQYYDNTSSDIRSLPGYFVMGANASYEVPLSKGIGRLSPKVVFSIAVDNILNNKYISSAWVYRACFSDGSAQYVEEGFFPQATTNFIAKIAIVL